MAKILVADDNSNIQKMVGVVLKDQGIDVVAVGNGEAAVRKISDVRPDLVLADVFMPVRNGYEVCKYVKGDSALAHIPVILLVGAFDPLDEQEAQRVGADGVLKKPFVPPDPLISMVKSALVRASSGQVAAISIEKPGAAPSPPAEITGEIPTAAVQPFETGAIASTQPPVEEVPPRPPVVKIESGKQPLAFGSLLQTPATNSDEDDPAFVVPNKELLERDWHSGEEEEDDEEEEEDDSSAWRRDGGNEAFGDDAEPAKEKPAAKRKKREAWTPSHERQQNLMEPEEPEFVAPPAPRVSAPTPAPPEPKISAPAPPPSRTAPAAPAIGPEQWKKTAPPAESIPSASTPGASRSGAPAGKDPNKPSTGSWFSVSSSPWDAEAQKASQLASAWDTAPGAPPAAISPSAPAPEMSEAAPAAEPQAPAPDLSYDFVSEEPSTEPVEYTPDPNLVRNEVVINERLPDLISDDALSPEAVESIRQETSYVLEDAAHEAVRRTEEASKSTSKEPEQSAALDVDAVVAKVLAKMNPEMFQAVTRELLKPIIEAVVREEIRPKK